MGRAILAFVIGAVCGIAATLYFQPHHPDIPDTLKDIVFPIGSSAFEDDLVVASGALTGEGVPYKNNTVLVSCYKSLGHCFAFEVDQIAIDQIGHIPLPVIFSITRWEPSLIVASTDQNSLSGYPSGCIRQTVNLARDRDKKVSVEFVEEPINQAKKICQNAPNVVRKWTLEEPAFWKQLTNQGQ